MKATDLMLNDLVMCNNKVCKVCSIEGVMILVSFKGGEKLTIEDNIEPIPLTPEILEKNGFEYDKNRKAYLMGLIFQLHQRFDGSFYLNGVQCLSIGAVHELQHALKLCQIDKKITL